MTNFEDKSSFELGNLLKSRRTINFFHPEPVPESLLVAAIDHARWAPNHKKTEPWHFHLLGEGARQSVIDLTAEIKSIGLTESGIESVRKRLDGIPGWFVISSPLSDNPVLQQEDYAACCCAAQNLMLYLWHHGVGVKWTTGAVTRDKRFFKLLGLDPALTTVVGLFWYGYPLQIPAQSRKDVSEILTRLD